MKTIPRAYRKRTKDIKVRRSSKKELNRLIVEYVHKRKLEFVRRGVNPPKNGTGYSEHWAVFKLPDKMEEL